MADCAHDVSLPALVVDGVAHRFSINGQAFVLLTIDLVPVLQCMIEMFGVHADQYITDGGHARYNVALVLVSASETLSGLLPKALGPVIDG